VSKAAMLAVVVRMFIALRDQQPPPTPTPMGQLDAVMIIVGTLAVASMIAGNLLGLFETRIKRLLAYSSIAHLGYAMLALLVAGPAAVEAAAFYMTAYLVTVIAAFGTIAVLEPETGGAPTIEAYRGLLWRRPVLGTILMAAMLSLAGIPATAGFVAKFLLLAAGVEAKLWIPVFALVLGSAIGVFYYLRVVVTLFARTTTEDLAHHGAFASRGPAAPTPAEPEVSATPVPFAAVLLLVVLGVLVIWLGTWPAPVLRLIESSVLAGI
jgi:NADH-quinone oxidoreductase subunit N